MDEQQIAAKVAENIQVEEHIPAPVTPEQPQESAFTSNVELHVNTYGQQLSDYFGLDRTTRHTEEGQRQLREVFRWASQYSKAQDIEAVFQAIRQLEEQLGISFKSNRLGRLARWIELDQKTRALRAQQEMITHGE